MVATLVSLSTYFRSFHNRHLRRQFQCPYPTRTPFHLWAPLSIMGEHRFTHSKHREIEKPCTVPATAMFLPHSRTPLRKMPNFKMNSGMSVLILAHPIPKRIHIQTHLQFAKHILGNSHVSFSNRHSNLNSFLFCMKHSTKCS